MKTTIKVTSVKQVKGFIHEYSIYAGDANRYNGNRSLTSRRYNPIALYVECIMNGEKKSFYTPTVIVTETSGFLNYKSMDVNSWFELIEEETKGFHGAKMFDGGDTPNVAIQTKSEILPKIKEGDDLNISYTISPTGKMNRVKIVKK